MNKSPCNLPHGKETICGVKCTEDCDSCGFNPAEQGRRLQQGQFIGGKLVFPPVPERQQEEETNRE